MADVKNARIYRHGDVALVPLSMAKKLQKSHRIQTVETDAEGRLILAFGEETGHYHAVEGANPVAASGGLILEVEKGKTATIKHLGYDGELEHTDIDVPPGKYVPVQQHEFDTEQGWSAAVD